MTSVEIPAGSVELTGELVLPHGATGIVLFAHGSGSNKGSSGIDTDCKSFLFTSKAVIHAPVFTSGFDQQTQPATITYFIGKFFGLSLTYCDIREHLMVSKVPTKIPSK